MTPSPSPAQQRWLQLRYGLFLHFGPNTLAGVGWGDGRFPAADVSFPELDCRQWADVAAEAGMRYAVLTTKHHDGFCLWPTRLTEYCVRNAPGRVDIVRQFVDAFRAAGLAVGFYYSLWDRNCPVYADDARYGAFMRGQITELLTEYGDVVELWFDGAWDKDHPTRTWPYEPTWERDPKSGLLHGERWEWSALYAHVKSLQPDCLVINNSGSDRPGGVRYQPVDVRTAEHYHFVWRGRVCEPNVEPVHGDRYLPLEYCTSLNPGWFYKSEETYPHPSGEAIAGWLAQARSHNANLLLNIGPDTRGRIPEYHRGFLRNAKHLVEDFVHHRDTEGTEEK